ncbi:hypothetical protein QAD02_005660 [Eretmocerus hayati]|uniref:Uncharacterized protein n=1 Tax=Eretmocerus hayati TaxID=131215 RepID=A0ACC2NU40_9HYME|nr:hypothetical protein QAD02_005660 [Eretmocerus hayati]
MRSLRLLILLVSVALIVDVDAAGWKFWKKKDKDNSTSSSTESATASSTTTTTTTLKSVPLTTKKPSAPNPKSGIAAAADPALAIGVGSNGQNIRDLPRKPNPGTEVGLDISQPKPVKPGVGPGNGQGYRDWAADLTGAGEGTRPRPKLPDQAPALAPQGAKPTSSPGTPTSQVKPTIATSTTAKPSLPVQPQPTQPKKPVQPNPLPASPTGSKSWAEIAGGGSFPSSSTPTPKSPGSPGNVRPGQSAYGNNGQAGRPSVSPGAALATGGAIGAIGAGAAAASNKYSSNPTFSKGKTVTDEDLEKLTEALFIKDANNAFKYITLNLQKSTTGSNPKDEASQPLLQVKPEALTAPTIQKVLTIYDNYKLDSRENEYINPKQREEESVLIDTFLSTNLMSMAMRFLADKGDGKIGSTGFEHVFLTELKLGTEVSGLHNWIYFNAEELKKRLDYLGYIKKVDLGDKAAIVKAHVKFNNIDKPTTSFFVGTSPELEMALYTVCFFARPEAACPVSLGGTKFNIITHKFRYRGKDLIGSAYPEI